MRKQAHKKTKEREVKEMKKQAHKKTKEREEIKLKEILKSKNRNYTGSTRCYDNCFNYFSNCKYKCNSRG